MEDKLILKAKFRKTNPLSVICYIIAIIAAIVCCIVSVSYGGDLAWMFEGIKYGYYWFFIGIAFFLLLGTIINLTSSGSASSESSKLCIYTSKISGETSFGKRVDLPISQISSVGIGRIFDRVTIATSSGNISFWGVANSDEVFEVISELILKHQSTDKSDNSTISGSAADEIKKMKLLLDEGIITQEEFDAKKKDLLGL